MPDKFDISKVLAIVDDTSKVDPMNVLDGLSDNWKSTDTVAMTTSVKPEPVISKLDHPGFALVEIGVIAVIFLSSFFYTK